MDSIRLAIAGIIKDYKAGLLAKKLGDLNPSSVYKWAEPSTENSPHGEIPLRRAIQLTLVTGDTRLMNAIAEEAGGVFVAGHQLAEGQFASEQIALMVMKSSAKLIEEYIEANEDNKVTPDEYKNLAREAMNLQLATAAVLASAKVKAGI